MGNRAMVTLTQRFMGVHLLKIVSHVSRNTDNAIIFDDT